MPLPDSKSERLGQLQALGSRSADDGVCQRMLAALVQTGRKAQHFIRL
jgi:hypothetical protein